MKVTVLTWLMPRWISYRLVPYLRPPGLTTMSLFPEFSLVSLARNSYDSIESRWSGKEPVLRTRKSFGNRASVSSRVLRLLSPILFALGVSQFPCALRDWFVLVRFQQLSSIFLRSRRLSSIFMRLYQFSRVFVDSQILARSR